MRLTGTCCWDMTSRSIALSFHADFFLNVSAHIREMSGETCDCALCQDEKCECECHTYEKIEGGDLPEDLVEVEKRSSLVPKVFAITGGVGAVLAGTAFTLLTGGAGVLAGGALTSAGMVSCRLCRTGPLTQPYRNRIVFVSRP